MDKRQATEFLGYLLRDKNIERTIYEDALKIAIESLKAQLSKENTTKDAISRQATIDALNVSAELLRRVLDDADVVGAVRVKYEWGLELIELHISVIKELPSAQPEIPPYVAEIEAEYKKWINVPYIRKPLAKALCEVWKKYDREETERRTDD